MRVRTVARGLVFTIPFAVVLLLLLAVWSGASASTAWQITRLTTNSVADQPDTLAEGFAVWRQWDGHDWELHLRNLADGVERQITDNDTNDMCAWLDGGHLVWSNEPLSGVLPHYTQVMIMTLPDGTPYAVTSADLSRVVTDHNAGGAAATGLGPVHLATGPMLRPLIS